MKVFKEYRGISKGVASKEGLQWLGRPPPSIVPLHHPKGRRAGTLIALCREEEDKNTSKRHRPGDELRFVEFELNSI